MKTLKKILKILAVFIISLIVVILAVIILLGPLAALWIPGYRYLGLLYLVYLAIFLTYQYFEGDLFE